MTFSKFLVFNQKFLQSAWFLLTSIINDLTDTVSKNQKLYFDDSVEIVRNIFMTHRWEDGKMIRADFINNQ